MCGRYSFFKQGEEARIELNLSAENWTSWVARYNAAPTQSMPVLTNEFPHTVQFFRWGLVPKWAKDLSIGNKMINTRTESILEKPAFKNIFRYKRCVVLSTGYYEWQATTALDAKGKQKIVKQPYRIFMPDESIMLMAGLWDTWRDGLNTFSIITCEASEDLAHLHNRMPVLLSHKEMDLWLSNDVPPEQLLQLLKPAPVGLTAHYAVSTDVNKPVNDFPELIEPISV